MNAFAFGRRFQVEKLFVRKEMILGLCSVKQTPVETATLIAHTGVRGLRKIKLKDFILDWDVQKFVIYSSTPCSSTFKLKSFPVAINTGEETLIGKLSGVDLTIATILNCRPVLPPHRIGWKLNSPSHRLICKLAICFLGSCLQ